MEDGEGKDYVLSYIIPEHTRGFFECVISILYIKILHKSFFFFLCDEVPISCNEVVKNQDNVWGNCTSEDIKKIRMCLIIGCVNVEES